MLHHELHELVFTNAHRTCSKANGPEQWSSFLALTKDTTALWREENHTRQSKEKETKTIEIGINEPGRSSNNKLIIKFLGKVVHAIHCIHIDVAHWNVNSSNPRNFF